MESARLDYKRGLRDWFGPINGSTLLEEIEHTHGGISTPSFFGTSKEETIEIDRRLILAKLGMRLRDPVVEFGKISDRTCLLEALDRLIECPTLISLTPLLQDSGEFGALLFRSER